MSLVPAFDGLTAAQHEILRELKDDLRRQFTVALKDGLLLDAPGSGSGGSDDNFGLSHSSILCLKQEQRGTDMAAAVAALHSDIQESSRALAGLHARIEAEQGELARVREQGDQAMRQLQMAREIIFQDNGLLLESVMAGVVEGTGEEGEEDGGEEKGDEESQSRGKKRVSIGGGRGKGAAGGEGEEEEDDDDILFSLPAHRARPTLATNPGALKRSKRETMDGAAGAGGGGGADGGGKGQHGHSGETPATTSSASASAYSLLTTPHSSSHSLLSHEPSSPNPSLLDDPSTAPGATPPATPPHSPSLSLPRSPVIHTPTTSGPIRPRRHVFEAHTTRLPALAAARCSVCAKSITFASKTIKCSQCSRCYHTHCLGSIPHDCRPPPFGTEAARRRKLPPFGCNLMKAIDAYSTSGRVPALIEDCIAAIDRRGLAVEGLYRVAVEDEGTVQTLKQHFFDGARRPNVMTVASIHVVAACLLSYLKDLDEPLLTFPLYGRFLTTAEEDVKGTGKSSGGAASAQGEAENVGEGSEEGVLERLGVRLLALPAVNFHTAMCITLHLKRVLAHSAQNKLHLDTLCSLFGPAYLCSPLGYEADESDHKMQMRVMELLLAMSEEQWTRRLEEVVARGPILFVHSPDPPEKMLRKATPKKEEEPR